MRQVLVEIPANVQQRVWSDIVGIDRGATAAAETLLHIDIHFLACHLSRPQVRCEVMELRNHRRRYSVARCRRSVAIPAIRQPQKTLLLMCRVALRMLHMLA